MSCGACRRAALMKRRTGAAIFCSTKRGSERESITRKPDRIDRPAHDVERARPGVLGRGTDLQHPLAAAPARRTAAAAPSPKRAEEITSAFVPRSMRHASVQSSTTTTSTTSPGSARASRAPSARPDTPPAQPRPNTGTRITVGRNPISGPTRASMLGVAIPVEDTVTTTSTSRAEIRALIERGLRRLHEQLAGALKIDFSALGQDCAARSAIRADRAE